MSLRNSIHETSETVITTGTDKGSAEALDPKPSLGSHVYKLYFIGAILLAIVVGLIASFNPKWAKENKGAIDKVTFIVDRPTQIVVDSFRLKWKGLKQRGALRYVGTGKHKDMKNDPFLKEKFFYVGTGFIMKDYVRESDYLSTEEAKRLNKKKGLNFPVFDVSYIEAEGYCKNLGPGYRLPTWEELYIAEKLYDEKRAKKNKALSIDFKKNLVFKAYETKDQWTSTVEPEAGGFFGFFLSFPGNDNYKIFSSHNHKKIRYEDDTYSHQNICFRCAKDLKKK